MEVIDHGKKRCVSDSSDLSGRRRGIGGVLPDGDAGLEYKLLSTVKALKEEQALREEQESKLYHEALSHTISYRSTRTEWVRLSRGGW